MKNISQNEAAVNRATEFNRWMVAQARSDGNRHAVGSAQQYVAQLRNWAHRLAPQALDGANSPVDLFERDRLWDFDTAVAIIAELPGYDTFIANNHGNFKEAVSWYRRFLEGGRAG